MQSKNYIFNESELNLFSNDIANPENMESNTAQLSSVPSQEIIKYPQSGNTTQPIEDENESVIQENQNPEKTIKTENSQNPKATIKVKYSFIQPKNTVSTNSLQLGNINQLRKTTATDISKTLGFKKADSFSTFSAEEKPKQRIEYGIILEKKAETSTNDEKENDFSNNKGKESQALDTFITFTLKLNNDNDIITKNGISIQDVSLEEQSNTFQVQETVQIREVEPAEEHSAQSNIPSTSDEATELETLAKSEKNLTIEESKTQELQKSVIENANKDIKINENTKAKQTIESESDSTFTVTETINESESVAFNKNGLKIAQKEITGVIDMFGRLIILPIQGKENSTLKTINTITPSTKPFNITSQNFMNQTNPKNVRIFSDETIKIETQISGTENTTIKTFNKTSQNPNLISKNETKNSELLNSELLDNKSIDQQDKARIKSQNSSNVNKIEKTEETITNESKEQLNPIDSSDCSKIATNNTVTQVTVATYSIASNQQAHKCQLAQAQKTDHKVQNSNKNSTTLSKLLEYKKAIQAIIKKIQVILYNEQKNCNIPPLLTLINNSLKLAERQKWKKSNK